MIMYHLLRAVAPGSEARNPGARARVIGDDHIVACHHPDVPVAVTLTRTDPTATRQETE
jgi:hypothetical protein